MTKKQENIGNEICKGVAGAVYAPEYFFGELLHELVKGKDDKIKVKFGQYTQNGAFYCVEFRGKYYNINVSSTPVVKEGNNE